MKNSWSVIIDEKPYNVQLNNRKLLINGEKVKLKSYKKKIGLLESLITEEYEIPLGSKTGLLVFQNMKSPQLIIDNKDCSTGEEYVPLNMPKWSYIFIVLHLLNFINGAIGWCFAIVGIAATTAVSANKKFSAVVKLILDLVILVLFFAITFGVAFAVVSL